MVEIGGVLFYFMALYLRLITKEAIYGFPIIDTSSDLESISLSPETRVYRLLYCDKKAEVRITQFGSFTEK